MNKRKMKPFWRNTIIITCGVIIFAASLTIAVLLSRMQTLKEVGLVSNNYFVIEETPVKLENFENKYASFLPDEKAEFLCRCCTDFAVDPDIVVSVLQVENPTLKENATSRPNENGTRDVGLFQLNDRSLYQRNGFLEMYWPVDFGEFNPDNWKHSTYIAVRHIKDLQTTFGESNVYFIAAGYNAGTVRAYDAYLNGSWRLPTSTQVKYAPSVVNYFNTWKALS